MNEDFTTLFHLSPALSKYAVSKALTQWFKEDMTFTHWEYVSGTGKGDSYMSDLIRIRIHGKNNVNKSKYVQVILKTMPKNMSRRRTFRIDEFFKNEINFYVHVLEKLLEFQATKDLKDPSTDYAKIFFAHTDGKTDCICLEDATLEGYGGALRQEGIDLEHCKISLKAFAKFHALSFAFKDQKPEKFEKLIQHLSEVYYHKSNWEWYEKFWARLCTIAIDAVEKEYPNTKYVEKVKEFATPKTFFKCVEAAESTFATGVVGQGDAWTNNILYKYIDGIPKAAKIIDFQLARCGSPVLDISFFIYGCTTQDLRLKHYDDLLEYYYDVLSKQISDLGSDPDKVYPKHTFMDEIKKYSFFGLAFSLESTPFIILDPEDAVNMEMQGEEKINICEVWNIGPIKTQKGRLREANNIVHCVDKGYI